MMPAPLSSPAAPLCALRPQLVHSRQRSLFCGCGQGTPAIAGLCRPCYRARARSRSRFGGHRERVLARDGRRCRGCGVVAAARRLHVHHRVPGLHDPERLVALCAACHARIHRLLALRVWQPDSLIELWREQHPGAAVQLQFPLELPGAEKEWAA